jgi:YD repeat-containing protein
VTSYGYAGTDVVSITDALQKTTNQSWSTNALLTMVTDPLTNKTQYHYNTITRLLQTKTDALLATTMYGYDANGYLLTVQDPLTHTVTTINDARGRPLQKNHAGRWDHVDGL